MGRKPCCERVGLKRGRWTAEEDAKLTEYIRVNGKRCWATLPKNAGLLRCGKSCRLRWMNYLRPDLEKRRFSSEEDDLIIHLHASLGSRWSLIARHLSGRTDNGIKNYWNSHLSRKIHPYWRRVISDRGRVSAMKVPKLDLPPEQKHGKKRSSRKKKQIRVQKSSKLPVLSSNSDGSAVIDAVAPLRAENGELCPETTMGEKKVEAEERRNILAADEVTANVWDGCWLQGFGREEDEILSWLLDGDDFARTNLEHESESQKLDAMFAWLLS